MNDYLNGPSKSAITEDVERRESYLRDINRRLQNLDNKLYDIEYLLNDIASEVFGPQINEKSSDKEEVRREPETLMDHLNDTIIELDRHIEFLHTTALRFKNL